MNAIGDLFHMRHALGLAERALGTTAPNPAVGCVIVAEGRIGGIAAVVAAFAHEIEPALHG